ncbi:MAG TPA: CDP-diacylglycerol--glycerol-3-phosphate 3-phosphatidyltransferase [Myxococcota bacterium]|nr:CDP-diacylglycerol--glycerol-3-phosphate 3-phosphatidyltransferase [Myxococcota bacterium]
MSISLDSEGTASSGPVPPLSRHALHAPPAIARERFWNAPNTITVLRAGVVPVLLFLPLFAQSRSASGVFAWIFIVAAVSDLVDGWLARRGKMVTHIGKLLDPLADKLLVATALIVLLAIGRIPLWALWMVVVIVGRELAVTGLRGLASAGGHVLPASGFGKLKTLTQNIAIGALLFHYETLGLDANRVGLVFLTVATVLTLASGYRYFADYFRGLSAAGSGGRS